MVSEGSEMEVMVAEKEAGSGGLDTGGVPGVWRGAGDREVGPGTEGDGDWAAARSAVLVLINSSTRINFFPISTLPGSVSRMVR